MIEPLKHLETTQVEPEQLKARFSDIAPPLTERQAALESARCLYCYDAPCVNACPSDIDIPEFIRQIAQDNVDGAAHTIWSENILGGSCARVCPTEILCEQACVRNKADECAPVLIGLLQRYATDNADKASHPFTRAQPTGKRVAIVGAGPAGLACAHRLAMHGHDVVIHEAQPKAGGLNEYGIARYKMTDDFAQKEVEFLLGIGGIEIVYGSALGRDISLSQLQADYDAVFLAIGLGSTRTLALGHEEAPGVMSAVDYIRELRSTDDLTTLPVPESAVVIGAGNTAIDMAVQIKRLGAEEVHLVYRRGEEPMSATGHEQALARDAGVQIRTWARPDAIELDNDGRVAGMRFVRTACDENGRLVDTDRSFTLQARAIFKAIGQVMVSDDLAPTLEISGGKLLVDEKLRTTLSGVYAGGDCTGLGQDLTVEAVQQGKQAAESIHQDLMAAGDH
jgi:glutamate synthase (NADPH/NADH) small chain